MLVFLERTCRLLPSLLLSEHAMRCSSRLDNDSIRISFLQHRLLWAVVLPERWQKHHQIYLQTWSASQCMYFAVPLRSGGATMNILAVASTRRNDAGFCWWRRKRGGGKAFVLCESEVRKQFPFQLCVLLACSYRQRLLSTIIWELWKACKRTRWGQLQRRSKVLYFEFLALLQH